MEAAGDHEEGRATTAEALLFERMLRAGDADNALEQGWFLRELRIRFGLSGEELSKRFGRTPSWVSRRLSLVAELPESVQAHVRAGSIGAHAAMKYLVPLARANRADGERLADAVAPLKLTTRQMAIVHAAWLGANPEARALILKDPALVVRAHEEARRAKARPTTPTEQVLSDLGALSGVAARLHQRTRRGDLRGLLEPERAEIRHAYSQACREVERLIKRLGKELEDARREHASGDLATP
jgi:transcriptional regulator with XRE-family HTH domain